MRLTIVDYGSGNLHSVASIFRHVAADTHITVSADPHDVAAADRVVLPGVGAFADCKCGLETTPGMIDALLEHTFQKQKPFLGICVGMQLLADIGEEHGVTKGLGWIKGRVVKIAPTNPDYKIPHMGWNTIECPRAHPVFNGLSGKHFYFVHSYHVQPEDDAVVLAQADYAQKVIAAIGRDNIVATQFHPEKSQSAGKALIGNFLKWNP